MTEPWFRDHGHIPTIRNLFWWFLKTSALISVRWSKSVAVVNRNYFQFWLVNRGRNLVESRRVSKYSVRMIWYDITEIRTSFTRIHYFLMFFVEMTVFVHDIIAWCLIVFSVFQSLQNQFYPFFFCKKRMYADSLFSIYFHEEMHLIKKLIWIKTSAK